MASGQGAEGAPNAGSPTPHQPQPRQHVYQSQPQLHAQVGGSGGGKGAGNGGDVTAREKRVLGAVEVAPGGMPHQQGAPPPLPEGSPPPLPQGSPPPRVEIKPHVASPASKRQRLEYTPDADADFSPRQRRPAPSSQAGSPKETMRAEYAAGATPNSLPSSPAHMTGNIPPTPFAPSSAPHAYTASSMPGGQWVWRADAANPSGSAGAWVWMAAPPPPPPSPAAAAPYAGPPYYAAHPGMEAAHYPGYSAWGPPTPSAMVPYAGYYPPPGTPATPVAGRDPYGAYMPSPGMYGSMHPPYYSHPGAGVPPYTPYVPGPSPYGPPSAPLLGARAAPQPQPQQSGTPRAQGRGGGGGLGPPKDPALMVAVAINRRITAAGTAREVFDIVEKEHPQFDSVCLATAMHKLANLRGAPNLHAAIVQAPEFYKLKQLILQRRGEFTARNLANTLWSLAKANHNPGDEFLSALAQEVKAKAREGNAQNVANMLWAFATLGFHPGGDVLEALAAAVQDKLWEFTGQNMSNTVLALAKLEFQPGEGVLEGLAREALGKIRSFTPQALSNTLWGLSKLGIQAHELMAGIGEEARARLVEFNSQNLANSVWAYANIGVNPGDDMLQDFARAAIQKMPDFSPQHISNFLWAFAKLDVRSPELFAQAGKHGARVMHTFTPQSISNMVWAYATLGECPDATFLHAMRGHALRLLPDFSPQNLSNTAWALATLKDCDSVRAMHRGLVGALSTEVAQRLGSPTAAQDFSRQHLANFVWALATLEHDPGKATLTAIAEALVARSDLCNPQEVSNSVWAFAKLGQYDGQLMNTMAAEATRRIDEFSQQNLSNLAWSYAKLAHMDEELLGAIAGRAEAMVAELSVQHCTNLVWAFASLKWATPTLMPALVAEVKARMASAQFNVQQLANLLWSLAIAERCDPDVWHTCLEQLDALGVPYHELPSEALTQIFQAYMLVLADDPGVEWPIPEALLALGQNAWVVTTKKIKVSEFHAEVSRALSAMGVGHTIEHLTDDHLFSVDIALPPERIALEVDGPRHFTANTFRPLGEMHSRHKLLNARGWRVVSVPFYHWSGESEDRHKALLQRSLDEARSQPQPEVKHEHAAIAARLAALQRDFQARLPQLMAQEDARVAAAAGAAAGRHMEAQAAAEGAPKSDRHQGDSPTHVDSAPEAAGQPLTDLATPEPARASPQADHRPAPPHPFPPGILPAQRASHSSQPSPLLPPGLGLHQEPHTSANSSPAALAAAEAAARALRGSRAPLFLSGASPRGRAEPNGSQHQREQRLQRLARGDSPISAGSGGEGGSRAGSRAED